MTIIFSGSLWVSAEVYFWVDVVEIALVQKQLEFCYTLSILLQIFYQISDEVKKILDSQGFSFQAFLKERTLKARL